MYVATSVMPGQKVSPPVRMTVPPRPKHDSTSMQQAQQKQPAAPARAESAPLSQKAAADNRVVRAELAAVTSQLQSKSTQLSRADAAMRQRDSEIAALRASLADRDSKLQDSRAELAELHAQIFNHEEGLQMAYNQLAEASKDKARVRQQLLENQAELSGVHTQLTEWSQDLHQLKSIMDTLEEEDEQLLSKASLATPYQPKPLSNAQGNGRQEPGQSLRDLTADVQSKTDAALSATKQTPSDSFELLEGIAQLSKQMVAEAKEDIELFQRAGRGVTVEDESRQEVST